MSGIGPKRHELVFANAPLTQADTASNSRPLMVKLSLLYVAVDADKERKIAASKPDRLTGCFEAKGSSPIGRTGDPQLGP